MQARPASALPSIDITASCISATCLSSAAARSAAAVRFGCFAFIRSWIASASCCAASAFSLMAFIPPFALAVPLAGFTAVASTREGAEHRLAFEPAPPDERAGDPKGRCSHFVAKAGWMRADDTLTVTATVTLDAKPVRVVWKNFVPKKYAHHED